MMTLENVKENFRNLIGKEFEESDMENEIIIAYSDYNFKGESLVQISKRSDTMWNTYVDHEESPEILLYLNWKEDEETGNKIYWIVEVDC